MIPTPGDRFRQTDGSIFIVTGVHVEDHSMKLVNVIVQIIGEPAPLLIPAEMWDQLYPALVRVKPEKPVDLTSVKLNLVENLVEDLEMMQRFQKTFAIGPGTIPGLYAGTEDVTVLVGMGPVAEVLKALGIRIHQELLQQKKNAQDPKEN